MGSFPTEEGKCKRVKSMEMNYRERISWGKETRRDIFPMFPSREKEEEKLNL